MSHDAHHRAAFFRQSGWLMIANIIGGAMMLGPHLLAKIIPPAAYGEFGVLLAATMVIPTIPLQMVFTQQTAAAIARNDTARLAGMLRFMLGALTVLWLVAAIVVLFGQNFILTTWRLETPVALWLTLPVVWLMLVSPVFMGALQGRQDFFWLGWTSIVGAAGRVGCAALITLLVAKTAGGLMAGVLVGLLLTVGLSAWQTRAVWLVPAEPFDHRTLLRQAVPLMLGFGACQVLFTADTMFVKRHLLPEDSGFYTAAGTLSRAMIWLVAPLATVMFPKLVHSTAQAKKSNLLGLTLAGTLVLSAGCVVGLMVLGPLAVRIIYNADYVTPAMKIIPWYAGAMVPLSLANVLANSLLARSDFRAVPFMLLVAVLYVCAQTWLTHSAIGVLQAMMVFTSLLFAVCAFFTWGPLAMKDPAKLAPEAA
jgi:O-antigen/teichoic acid export membrane protein